MSTTTISSMSVKPLLIVPVPPGPQLRNYVHCIPLWLVGLSNRSRPDCPDATRSDIDHALWQLETEWAVADRGECAGRERGPAAARQTLGVRQRFVDLTVLVGEWLLDRLDRLVARFSRSATRPSSPHERVPLGLRPRGELADDPRRARPRPRAPRRAAELPGHLDRPGVDHRRRPVEDVLPLRLRLPLGHQLRALPRDRATRRRGPRDEDGDVLDPRPRQAHPRPQRPVQGRDPLPPGAEGPRAPGAVPDPGRRRDRDLERGREPASSTTPTSTRCGTTPTTSGSSCSSTWCARCGSR